VILPLTETLSISLPSPVLREALHLANSENRSLDDLVLDALRRYHPFDAIARNGAGRRSLTLAAPQPTLSGFATKEDVVQVIHEFRREQRGAQPAESR